MPSDLRPDLVIEGCTYLAATGPAGARFEGPVTIAVRDGTIASIAPSTGAPPDAGEVIDGSGLVAMPGFINGHTHAAMTMLRGAAEDVTVDEWFNDRIWPMEVNLTERDVYIGTLLAAAEMIESGVTTFVDHYFYMDAAARAVAESGLRANLGSAFFSSQGPGAVEASVAFAEAHHDTAGGRITTSVAPHATYTCNDADLRAAADHARRLGIKVHVHAAETIEQTESSIAQRGITPIQVLAETGVLDAGAIIAHGKGVIESDYPLLVEHRDRVGIPHSAKGYLKTGTNRLTPIRDLLGLGVAVGLGTDGPASHNTLDILESLRFLVISQKFVTHDATWMDRGTALELAGPLSAKAIGMGDQIGALQAGYRADIVLFDLGGAHCQPVHDIAAAILYSARASDVRTTIVDGKVLMRDRVLTTIDRAALIAEVAERAGTITDRSHGRSIQTYDP
jgi:5-methylthioadenosine/S-adenosylhomocysteine deaminase